MDWLTIVTNLLPLLPVPGGAQATALAQIAADLIQRIKAQSDMTTDEILQQAGVTLDENKRMLLDDLERLQGDNP